LDVNASSYQRIRLWSGIVSIGANLGIIFGLYLSAPWWSSALTGHVAPIALLVVLPFSIALANLPFEILSGHACESAANRTCQSLGDWLQDWAREVAPICFAQAFGLLFFYGFAVVPGGIQLAFAALTSIAVVALGLLRMGSMGRTVRCEFSDDDDFTRRTMDEREKLGVKNVKIEWADLADETTVNGGIRPFANTILLSTSVRGQLSPREVALLCAREQWLKCNHAGSAAAAWIAAGWLLLGVGFALAVPAANPMQAAIGGAAVVSMWSFAALFVWPPLNQKWARRGDNYLARISSPHEARTLLTKIQTLNQTDVALPPGKANVFHPIPPLASRIESLP
jgi:hypothetical protein